MIVEHAKRNAELAAKVDPMFCTPMISRSPGWIDVAATQLIEGRGQIFVV